MLHKWVVGVMILLIWVGVLSAQDRVLMDDTITAEGDGTVAMNGSGAITITGKGLLFIVDRTGDTMIELDNNKRYFHDKRKTRGNTTHTYRRFDGTAVISGEDMAVLMQGINIQVSISGTGMVLLEGTGEYTLEDDTMDWSLDGVMIELGTRDD